MVSRWAYQMILPNSLIKIFVNSNQSLCFIEKVTYLNLFEISDIVNFTAL